MARKYQQSAINQWRRESESISVWRNGGHQSQQHQWRRIMAAAKKIMTAASSSGVAAYRAAA